MSLIPIPMSAAAASGAALGTESGWAAVGDDRPTEAPTLIPDADGRFVLADLTPA
jgi:hypothetical protein